MVIMIDQICTYHPVSDLCVSSVQNSFTIYNSLCVGLSLLFVAVFQSSPKAVGGRQYERTTDTFGFCKILFSHFPPLMIIIMFSSNTFKCLGILIRSLKIYWLQMGFFTDAQTVLEDDQTNLYGIFGKYLEIYLGYLGFSTGAQTVLGVCQTN